MEVDVRSLASEFPNDNPGLHGGTIWVCHAVTGPAEAVLPPPRTAPPPILLPEPEADASIVLAEPEPETVRVDVEPLTVRMEAEPEPYVVEELEPLEASGDVETVSGIPGLVGLEPSGEIEIVSGQPMPDDAPREPEPEISVMPELLEDVVLSPPPPLESSVLPTAPDDPFTLLVCTLADVAIHAGSPHVASVLPGLLFDGRLPEPLDERIATALRERGILDGAQVTAEFATTTAAWREILRGTSDDFSACGSGMLDEWSSELLAILLEAPQRAPTLRQELRSRGVAAFGLAA